MTQTQSPTTSTSTPPALHIVSADGAPPTTPSTRVPTPSPAPAADREVADLRGHLAGPKWAETPATCVRAMRWQLRHGLDDVTAARTVGLPHITADSFRRFREHRRPFGVGHHWPEFTQFVIETETQMRVSAALALQPAAPTPITSAVVVATPATPTTPAVVATPQRAIAPIDLAMLASDLIGFGRSRTSIDRNTAHRVAVAQREYKLTTSGLARALCKAAKQGNVKSWDSRLRGYRQAFPELFSTSQLPLPSTLVPAPLPAQVPAPVAAKQAPDELKALVKIIALESKINLTTRRSCRTPETSMLIAAAATKHKTQSRNELAGLLVIAAGESSDPKAIGRWNSRLVDYERILRDGTPKPPASAPAPAPAPVVAAPSVLASTTSQVTLAGLRDTIAAECANQRRTSETAKVVRDLATARAKPDQLQWTYKVSFPGSAQLANELAQVDANSRGEAPDAKLRRRWAWRVDAYKSLIDGLPADAVPNTRPAAKVTAAVPATATTTTSALTLRLVGRPKLLADGRLEVRVTETRTIAAGDPLWSAAMAAVNAS